MHTREIVAVGVDGVPTVSLHWPLRGAAVADAASVNTFVMFPGNPGVADYYIEFLNEVHGLSDGQIEVFCVGHAGHSTLPAGYQIPRPYTMAEQVQHKANYIKQLHAQNPKRRFMLAGHSVGAYISLQVIKALPECTFDKVFLLLPTLHHIMDTPRGRELTPLTAQIPRTIVSFIAAGFNLLPLDAKIWIVGLGSNQPPVHARIAAEFLLHPKVAYNCFFMGNDEMHNLRELDEDTIRANLTKLSFHYGHVDGWVPREHYTNMKAAFPEGDIKLCDEHIPHAFVLGHGKEFGQTIGGEVQEYLLKNTKLKFTAKPAPKAVINGAKKQVSSSAAIIYGARIFTVTATVAAIAGGLAATFLF